MTHIVGDVRNIDLAKMQRYGVILMDPPWQYDFSQVYDWGVDAQYNTLTQDDLRAMPIPDLALPDCVLFVWGTWPKLPLSIDLIQHWGFEYVTGLPWVKLDPCGSIQYKMGYWVRGCSEFILIARRGKVSPPRKEGFLGLISPNLQHSRKPDSIHEIAEALPGPHLELFARRDRAGWDCFGNHAEEQLPLFATLDP
jgi:N6-adenosine-specific RNA methylase IME4